MSSNTLVADIKAAVKTCSQLIDRSTVSPNEACRCRAQLNALLQKALKLGDDDVLSRHVAALRAGNKLLSALRPYAIQHSVGCSPDPRQYPDAIEALRESVVDFLLEGRLVK